MAPARTSTEPFVRFGEFEAQLASGELWRHGQKVRLQRLPFALLGLLLNRPGEVVSREEVRAHLWPDGTHVDFEHGVNTALRKLRRALGDLPRGARYVETLPGRGYRFVALVTRAEPDRGGELGSFRRLDPLRWLARAVGDGLAAPFERRRPLTPEEIAGLRAAVEAFIALRGERALSTSISALPG